MNILLMTPPVPKNTPWALSEKMPPLGIGFLISVLKEDGHRVYFVDNVLETSFNKNILRDKKIDFVGLYLNTICFFEGCSLLFEIERMREKREWNGKIMVGGPHPSVRPEDIPDFVAEEDRTVKDDGRVDITSHSLKVLESLGIEALIPIGGDDTLSYAGRIHKEGRERVLPGRARGHAKRRRRAVPEVPAPRLSSSRMCHLAVVRMPLPWLAVQPHR